MTNTPRSTRKYIEYLRNKDLRMSQALPQIASIEIDRGVFPDEKEGENYNPDRLYYIYFEGKSRSQDAAPPQIYIAASHDYLPNERWLKEQPITSSRSDIVTLEASRKMINMMGGDKKAAETNQKIWKNFGIDRKLTTFVRQRHEIKPEHKGSRQSPITPLQERVAEALARCLIHCFSDKYDIHPLTPEIAHIEGFRVPIGKPSSSAEKRGYPHGCDGYRLSA